MMYDGAYANIETVETVPLAVYYRGGFMGGKAALYRACDLHPVIRQAKMREPALFPVPNFVSLFDYTDIEEYNLRRDALGQLCYVKRGSGIKLSGWQYDGVRDDG